MHLNDTGAIVDERHREKLSQESWTICNGYAGHYALLPDTGKNAFIHSMHQRVWQLEYGHPVPKTIDHINRNRLDNRVENLRPATHSLQSLNTRTKRKRALPQGVCLSQGKYFQASIGYRNKAYHLGLFDTPEAAAACYESHRAALMDYEAAIARGEEVPPLSAIFPAKRRRGAARLSRSLVLELSNQGMTVGQMAEKLSVTKDTIKNALKDLGIYVPGKNGRPRKNLARDKSVTKPRSIFTSSEVS